VTFVQRLVATFILLPLMSIASLVLNVIWLFIQWADAVAEDLNAIWSD
jgi:hypothetical protein